MIKTLYTGYARKFEVIDPGYIDTRYIKEQYFVKDTLFLGVRIWRKTLFKETIPTYAWVSLVTVGYTDWKSGCPEDIWKLCITKNKFNILKKE